MTIRRNRFLNDEGVHLARGAIHGANIRNIFGVQADIGDGYHPVWELAQDYVYPTQATTLDVQTAATDTATIKIIGLDADYEEISEVVVLNGIIATDQTTTQEFFRVNDLITIAGNCAGDVTLVETGGSNVLAKMTAGLGRNQAAIYTVPAGCEFHLTRLNGFTADTGASPTERTAFFRNRVQLASGVILRVAELAFHNSFEIYRTNPFMYSEKTDIQFQMRQAQANSSVEVSIFGEGILYKP